MNSDPEDDEPQRPDFGWPHPGAFSPQELEWVLKLRKDEGLSLRAIGEITGRSFSHIDRVCRKAGLDSDLAKPKEPAPKSYNPSPLSDDLRKLGEKASRKAHMLLDQISEPITIRRVNTRTGATERLKLHQPDPSEQRDLAQGASNLIGVVQRAVAANSDNGGRAGIIEFFDRVRHGIDHPIARVTAMNQILKGQPPTTALEWAHQNVIVLEFEGGRTEAFEGGNVPLNPGGFEPTAAHIAGAKSALGSKFVTREVKPIERTPDVQPAAPTGPIVSRMHDAAIT
jgi:hypothetical protein